jgi:flagellar assembly factor FliW
MRLTGTRFGTVEFESNDILSFNEGLIGFPALKHFVMVSNKPDSPFRWMQSIEDPATAFLLADPIKFYADYSPEISEKDQNTLGVEAETPCLVYVTASIPPGHPEEMTLNLAAPLIINALSRVGKQVILEDEAYTIKHRVLQAGRTVAESVAA